MCRMQVHRGYIGDYVGVYHRDYEGGYLEFRDTWSFRL